MQKQISLKPPKKEKKSLDEIHEIPKGTVSWACDVIEEIIIKIVGEDSSMAVLLGWHLEKIIIDARGMYIAA